MSKVDDELARRFHRAERPLDVDELFEGISRRRHRQQAIRRVEGVFLAIAVVVATGGGFLALRSAFNADRRSAGSTLPINGEIVFSRVSRGGQHLFLTHPDGQGVRQLTYGEGGDLYPAWSPDGRSIVFVRQTLQTMRLFVLSLDTGLVRPITPPNLVAERPAWSPDGSLIAFAGFERGPTDESHDVVSGIWVVHPDGTDPRRLTEPIFAGSDGPVWAPDGAMLAFTSEVIGEDGRDRGGTDVFLLPREGGVAANLTDTRSLNEFAVGWIPSGNLVIGETADPVAAGPGMSMAHGRLLEFSRDGSVLRTILNAPPNPPRVDAPTISPDGQMILFEDATEPAVWSFDIAKRAFTRIAAGGTPAWQPVVSQPAPSDSAAPTPTASPNPDIGGRDIGLGFKLCDLHQLQRIDWYGDRTSGSAWTGAQATTDGRCPEPGTGKYVVAADLDGDGIAEPGGMGFLANCFMCRPYATTDLNADGVLELVVLEEASSTVSYSFYEVSVPTSERSPGIYNLFVAPPGAPTADIPAGDPLRVIIGGDEGFSGGVACEGFPEAPILVYTWVLGPVDADTNAELHVTRVQLGEDGAFHVLESEDSEVPNGTRRTIPGAPACGVDFSAPV